MSDESRVKELLSRKQAIKSRRGLWEPHWDDLARVMLTRRLGFVTQVMEGDRRTEDIFDGTPMQAARALANAIGGMQRPEGQQWFFIRTVEDRDGNSDEAKDWLADSEDRLQDALNNPKARFRQAVGEADSDLTVLGTAVVFIGEGNDSLLFQTLHLKDALPFFGETGNAEGMFRDRRFTVRQAVARFKLENLSETVKRQWDNHKLDDYVDFVHAVVPRSEGRVDAILARNLPWADLWIEVEEERLVSTGGFREYPFAVPRWDTSAGEEYGRSPGMIALSDSNTAQAMGSTLLIAGQRAATPPLLVPDDSTFDAANTFPDGITYYDADLARDMGRIPIASLESGANIPLTREMQEDTRKQIWNAFFRDILKLPPSEREMTATEINARREEFIREIGPVFARLETDYTAPIIERSFNILLRAGAFAPIPEVLSQTRIRFEYESPVKRFRQQIESAAAKAWAQEMLLIDSQRPDAPDKASDLINVDVLGRFTAEADGLPNRVVNGTDAVAAIRKQRADAQAQAEQLAQLQVGVETAATAADAASKAGLIGEAA